MPRRSPPQRRCRDRARAAQDVPLEECGATAALLQLRYAAVIVSGSDENIETRWATVLAKLGTLLDSGYRSTCERSATLRAAEPTGRFITRREVATLVALLASPRTANVRGSSHVIDGGLIKTM